MILNNISVVLCNTSHPGNIGSTARAMKTMGITNLILVDPITKPDDHTMALASNAKDVVESAKIVDNIDDALTDTTIAIAMTSRRREFQQHIFTPREIAPQIIDRAIDNQKIALVFGSEKNGLTITQLEKCNRLITIPGNPEYCSLNLAQAVQIICYEIYTQYINNCINDNINNINNTNNNNNSSSNTNNSNNNTNSISSTSITNSTKPSTFADTQGILNHLDSILTKVDFYHKKNTERVKRNLQHIIHKASLERDEVDLIRGMLTKISQNI